jgi:hypothetical protein
VCGDRRRIHRCHLRFVTAAVRSVIPGELALTLGPDAPTKVNRQARQDGLRPATCCQTFHATGISNRLQNGGTIEHAQQIANHTPPRTTQLYHRTNDATRLDEFERILT